MNFFNVKLFKKLFVIYFLLISAFTFPQKIKFDRLSVEDGLSQDNVLWIHQDKMGFMWIATEDGLDLYNGYTFKIFRNDPEDSTSISNNHVIFIAEDTTGNIWLGTQNGLNYYDRKSDKFERFYSVSGDTESLTNNEIDYLFFDSKNKFWIGTGSGLNLYLPGSNKFRQFRPDPNDPHAFPDGIVKGIIEDSAHQLWFATMSGLSRMNPDSLTFTNYLHSPDNANSLSSNQITALYEEDDQHLWVGTIDAGLDLMDKTTGSCIHYIYKQNDPTGLLSSYIKNINKDKQGNLWLATDGGLDLMNKQNGTFTGYAHSPDNEQSLASNILSQVYFDRNNRMWVATRFGGIDIYDKDKTGFRSFKHSRLDPNSLSGDNVNSFAEDKKGNIWIGVDGGGLNYYNRQTGKFTIYKHQPDNPNSISNDKVLALNIDKQGELWIGYWDGGLDRYNPFTKEFKHYIKDPSDSSSLSDNNIFYIFIDSKDNIWIATWGAGVCKYNRETDNFTQYNHDPDNPNSIGLTSPDGIAEDQQGNIWIAFERYGGVDMFDPTTQKFTHYKAEGKKGDLTENAVYSVFVDSKNRLWVGTNGGGLNLFDRKTKTFRSYHMSDGLPNETIMGMLEGDDHNLWISTNKGLCKFNPDSLTFKNYDITDGLQNNQFNRWAFKRLSTGDLLFGGVSGFNLFNPKDIKDNAYIPPVYITDFKLFNKPVKVGTKEVLKKDILFTKVITLNYKQNFFSFEFTALNYRQSEKNKYKYFMEGLQDDWINAGNERKATFTNMSPGKYVFRVIASNNDGVWNTKGTSVKINIIPPFWKTWWFITLLIIMVIGVVYYFIKKREQDLKHDKQILEEKIQEGMKIVEKQKLEVEHKDKELKDREIAEREQKWYNRGMVKFGETLSKNKEDLVKLSNAIISDLVKYVVAVQGAIYLYDDTNEDDTCLKLMAGYAMDEKQRNHEKILPGEGQIGTCYKEQRIIQIENLPESYAKLSSGLGSSSPTHALMVPLKLDETIIGVIELTSFEKLESFKLDFIEKLNENITSYLVTLQANARTSKLLEKSRMYSEEIASQEEELRQNMEEMQATQEESARREEEFKKREIQYQQKIDAINKKYKEVESKLKNNKRTKN